MISPWAALAGAGVGALKTVGDKRDWKRAMHDKATSMRLSPYTGVSMASLLSSLPQEPSYLSNMLAFGSTGASIGSGMDAMNASETMNAARLKNLDAQTALYEAAMPAPVVAGEPQAMGSFWSDYLNYDDNNMNPMFSGYRAGV